jgi:hypothetical protein
VAASYILQGRDSFEFLTVLEAISDSAIHSDQLFLIDKQRNKASLPELSLSDFMDLIGAHPQLAPEVVQVLSNALKTAERRVHELEQELAEQVRLPLGRKRRDLNHRAHNQKAFSSSSTAGGIPPCSSQCCPDKIQKISEIESDLARLQSLENSEIQKVHQMIFSTAAPYLSL